MLSNYERALLRQLPHQPRRLGEQQHQFVAQDPHSCQLVRLVGTYRGRATLQRQSGTTDSRPLTASWTVLDHAEDLGRAITMILPAP